MTTLPPAILDALWIVVPAYNEEGVVRSVVEALTATYPHVVVVNDASTDGTRRVLEDCGAHLVTHPINLGQGAALQTGISYALAQGARYIVTCDSDGQHRPEEIPTLVSPLLNGNVDVVLGSRFVGGEWAEGMPKSKRLLLKLATTYTRLSTGLSLTDTHNGFRAMTADAARKIRISQNRMAHGSQILSRIAQHHLRFVEVPVRVRYTEYSLQKGQKMTNSFNIMWESFTEMFRL